LITVLRFIVILHRTVIAQFYRFLRTHPVSGFAMLVFAVAYGVGLPVQVAFGMFLPGLDTTTAHYLGRVFVVGAPAIAALVLTRAAGDGHTERWIAQLRPTPIVLRWLPIAIIGATAIIALAFLSSGHSAHTLLATLSQEWQRLLLIFLLELAIVGVGEELGWRGWLLPTLLARGCSPLGASLRVGALWGIWHVPILLQGPTIALAFVVTTIGLSILHTALWLRTFGSVLVAAAAHAACNASFEMLSPIRWTSVAIVTSVCALVVVSAAFSRRLTPTTEHSGAGGR
jgi:uncharacterized protein